MSESTVTIDITEHATHGPVIGYTAPFRFNELIKEAGGRWWTTGKMWWAPLSWGTCVRARGVFGDMLSVGPELADWSRDRYEFVSRAMALRDEISFEGREWSAEAHTDGIRRLYPHQDVGRRFLGFAPSALLSDEMGTGKSATLLSALDLTGALPALVVCPVAVRRNWVREAAMWLPGATPYEIRGTPAKRAKTLAEAATDPTALVVINFEGVRAHSRLAPYGSIKLAACIECDPKTATPELKPSQCHRHVKELNRIPFKAVITDEAHRAVDPSSLQTRSVWAVAHGPTVTHRWAATGTPVVNHPGDLWSILHMIAPDQWPGKVAFTDRYCIVVPKPFGGVDITGLRPDMREEFFKIFDPMFRRMTKERVLPFLPPKIYSTLYTEMSPKQAKAYKDIKESYETQLGEDWLTLGLERTLWRDASAEDDERGPIGLDLLAAGRMTQFANAYGEMYDKPVKVVNPDGTATDSTEPAMRLSEPSSKLDLFMETIEKYKGKPVVACAEHRQLIELASARLNKAGIRHVLITGAQTQLQRDQALADFQAGHVDLLLFTLKAGGTGLTMTRADTMIRIQRSWSMVDNAQAEDRIHRLGSEQHSSVHIVDLVTADTIEERQIYRMQDKAAMANEVTRDAVH